MVSLRSLVAGAALVAAPVMAALTPTQIVDGLNLLTSKSQKLQPVAQSITIVNAPLIIIGQGPFPALISGFTDMVTTSQVFFEQNLDTATIQDETDATSVLNAFRGFARVTQELLNILIGKAGILEQIPLISQPVATVLRSFEGCVDNIAFFLINTVEPRAQDLAPEANSLGSTLDICIQKYEGLQVKKRAEVFVA